MLKKCLITVEDFGVIRADPGRLMLEVLNERGIDLHNDCGGLGKCGKCRIVYEGSAPEPLASDRRLLSKKLIDEGCRLACFHQVRGDCSIAVPQPPELELLDDI